jgi:hypothetical protein
LDPVRLSAKETGKPREDAPDNRLAPSLEGHRSDLAATSLGISEK